MKKTLTAAVFAAAVLAAGALMPAAPAGTETKTLAETQAEVTSLANRLSTVESRQPLFTAVDNRITALEGTVGGMQSIQTRNRAIINALPNEVPKWALAEVALRDELWTETQQQVELACRAENRAQTKKTWAEVSPAFDLTGFPSTAPDAWEFGGLMEHEDPRNTNSRRETVGCLWWARWNAPTDVDAVLTQCARADTTAYRIEELEHDWDVRHRNLPDHTCPRRDADGSYQLTTPALPTPPTTTAAASP